MPYINKRLRSFHMGLNSRAHEKTVKRREHLLISDPEAFSREIERDLEERRRAEDDAKYRRVMCKIRWGDEGPLEISGRPHACGDGHLKIIRKLEFVEAQGVWVCPECNKEWDPLVPYFEKNYRLSFRQMALAMLYAKETKKPTVKGLAQAMKVSLTTAYRTMHKIYPIWHWEKGEEPPNDDSLTNEDFQTHNPER